MLAIYRSCLLFKSAAVRSVLRGQSLERVEDFQSGPAKVFVVAGDDGEVPWLTDSVGALRHANV